MNLIKVDTWLIDDIKFGEFRKKYAEGHFHMDENGNILMPRQDADYYVGPHSAYLMDNTREVG